MSHALILRPSGTDAANGRRTRKRSNTGADVAAQALSRSTEALHLGSEPWHDEHFGAEEHRSIQVDDRQGVSLTEPIFLAQGCWKGQGPAPSDIPSDLRHGGLGKHQTKEAKLAEDQNHVAGARARQQSGNQDVSIDTNEYRFSLLGPGHPNPSGTAFALDGGAPSRQRAVARRALWG